jgi:hypothetical protein
MRSRRILEAAILTLATVVIVSSCGKSDESEYGYTGGVGGKADSAAHAVFLDFEFDGRFITDCDISNWPGGQVSMLYADGEAFKVPWCDSGALIRAHLLWAVGQLNSDGAGAHLNSLQLTNVSHKEIRPCNGVENGADCSKSSVSVHRDITYHAVMTVAWPANKPIPSVYSFILPGDNCYLGRNRHKRDASYACRSPEYSSAAHDGFTQFGAEADGWFLYDPMGGTCPKVHEHKKVLADWTPVHYGHRGIRRSQRPRHERKISRV